MSEPYTSVFNGEFCLHIHTYIQSTYHISFVSMIEYYQYFLSSDTAYPWVKSTFNDVAKQYYNIYTTCTAAAKKGDCH